MNFLSDDVLSAGTGAGGGGEGGLTGLLQNKLFLQYLAGAGSDISAGRPIGNTVNAITQQNISAQNYMKVLQKMLGGQMPEGGKLTMDTKGMKLDVPQSALSGGSFLGDNPLGQPFTGGTGSPSPTSSPSPTGISPSQYGTINPFVGSQSGNISASDLAGLTPQDIHGAFSGALAVENLKQKKASDLVDAMYKGALTKKAMEGDPLDKAFPIGVPGVGAVTIRQWKSLPKEDQEYAVYVHGAKNLGDKDIMSKAEWKMVEPTERERFTRAVMKDPKLMGAAKSLAAAGATRISLEGKLEEKKAMAGIEAQNYFTSGKFVEDVGKHLNSKDVQSTLFQSDNPSKAKSKEAIKHIEGKIVGGGGSIDSVSWDKDGKTMVWKVRWPSGDVKEVKYGVK